MKKEGVKLFVDGKRLDGRELDELRPIKMEVGVLKRADGSAYLEWGENKILAACYGPREVHPRHMEEADKAIVRVRYNMAPFSVPDRKRPGPDRRSQEISKVTKEALESVVLTHLYPKTVVDVFIEVLQANAGTRCAGITAASLAMADAGIPMRDLISSCAAGKIDGKVAVDMMGAEDNFGEADLPLAIAPQKKEVTLLQMDGNFTRKEFEEAFNMAMKGCLDVYEIQKQALLKKYEV
ncbi:MAG TPA: exosome complex exonuclease Rrp41 [Euryarchaeota archaeon]|nr:polyribonucleotide nucleotidyltransferase [archaeon BMS3Abin16]GBE56643.1 polyribonucleotide nucleotidyltransferase [archaeon BMS3Bbin16]HDH28464.1 exosome complex exonuclease Rrp41 [Euryarchaeota archaeon]HDY73656.1 exosome complex exonuclease Rrp41 [Euryarchaeota archaeon]